MHLFIYFKFKTMKKHVKLHIVLAKTYRLHHPDNPLILAIGCGAHHLD